MLGFCSSYVILVGLVKVFMYIHLFMHTDRQDRTGSLKHGRKKGDYPNPYSNSISLSVYLSVCQSIAWLVK